jgi:serine/threonine-protein kinase RsbW
MTQKFELVIDGDIAYLPKVSNFINQTMQTLKVENSKDKYAISLSVDEAITNLIQHAYKNKPTGKVIIECVLSGKEFTVNILDFGAPFDPTKVSSPDIESGIAQRKEGGLGVFFMKKFMDKVEYFSGPNGNKLVMVKYLSR